MAKVVVVKVRKHVEPKRLDPNVELKKHVDAMKAIAEKYVSMKKLLQEELNAEIDCIMDLLSDEEDSDKMTLEDLLRLFK